MDPHFLFNALNTIPGLMPRWVMSMTTGVSGIARDAAGAPFLLEQEVQLVEHYLRISENSRM
ncbi:MAG: histidine kinase [Flavobacteriales bacterium]|nr:histidine kinase [Flavobacteriales bacterium]